jgi:hypothetical protein
MRSEVAVRGWELQGTVRHYVTLSTSRLEFGDQCAYAGPEMTRKVRVRVIDPKGVLEANVQPNLAKVAIVQTSRTRGEYDLAITPDPSLPLGPFQFAIALTVRMPNQQCHRSAAIDVLGVMQPSTRVVPSVVLLGEHPVAAQATAEVSIYFPDPVGWSVEQIDISSPGLSVEPIQSVEVRRFRYRLVQVVREHGNQTNEIQFKVKKPGGDRETVRLAVAYYGVSPQGER